MRTTADVTGGKPIGVFLLSTSGVGAISPLVVFYDIHGEKREVLFFYLVIYLVLSDKKIIKTEINQTLVFFHILIRYTYIGSLFIA
jgi:hypothetical protein